MAHFAKVENNIVVNVIVAEQDFIDSLPDSNQWIKTSYNMRGGVYYDSSTNSPAEDQSVIQGDSARMRKNYAGIGYTYDESRDAFIPPQPYPSWTLNEETCLWDSPVPYPTDGERYNWNEENQTWDLIPSE
jgi:hypothetical protein